MASSLGSRWLRWVWWAALAALFVFFLNEAIHLRFLTPGATGPSLMRKQAWYWGHFLFALPAVLLGAAQFSARLRATRPDIHRWVGRSYAVLALLAGLAGLWLGMVADPPGARMPAVILALLWLGFTAAGWLRARAGDYVSHRQLMTRSYCLIWVFVWSRLVAEPWLAPLWTWIKDPAELIATQSWAGILIPILLVEAWLSWRPLAMGRAAGKVTRLAA